MKAADLTRHALAMAKIKLLLVIFFVATITEIEVKLAISKRKFYKEHFRGRRVVGRGLVDC